LKLHPGPKHEIDPGPFFTNSLRVLVPGNSEYLESGLIEMLTRRKIACRDSAANSPLVEINKWVLAKGVKERTN
jgi:hypothetical protein